MTDRRDYHRSPAAAVVGVAGGRLSAIAAACGVSTSTVSRWLAGRQRPHSGLREALTAEVGEEAAAAVMRLVSEAFAVEGIEAERG